MAACERACEENFFGHPAIKTLLGAEGQRINAPQVQGKTRDMIELSRRVAPILDGITAARCAAR